MSGAASMISEAQGSAPSAAKRVAAEIKLFPNPYQFAFSCQPHAVRTATANAAAAVEAGMEPEE
jgi:hypothetical protein